jgi:hypothetical protein
MDTLIATIDEITARYDGETYLPARRLIDPLLMAWDESLEAPVKLALGSFLTPLPGRDMIARKEWDEFTAEIKALALVTV